MGGTIAIIDFAHSGTTMLAGICEILGVPMAIDDYHEMKWEDHSVIEAIQQGGEAFAAMVKERNETFPTWGFKYPGAWKHPDSLVQLREPIYLAIYKDPVSVTRRRFGKSNVRFLHRVQNTVRQMTLSVEGLYQSRLPVHMLSYHYAITRPEKFVKQVAEIICQIPAEDQISKAIAYIQPNKGGPRKNYPEVKPWI